MCLIPSMYMNFVTLHERDNKRRSGRVASIHRGRETTTIAVIIGASVVDRKYQAWKASTVCDAMYWTDFGR